MMLPILISVSVTPGSYFFCAAAGSMANARPSTMDASSTPRICVMSTSLMPSACCRSIRHSRVQARNMSIAHCYRGKETAHPAERNAPDVLTNNQNSALLARHHRPEQLPALALESHHLQLLERGEIGRAGLDMGARQIDADLEIQIGGLLHDVFAGQVVAALPQDLLQSFGHAVAEGGGGILLVAFGIPLGHEGAPFVH